MTITIRAIGPCFTGEVHGLDMRNPLSGEEIAAIHAGMDKYAVLVFRDQKIDDAQQLAFSRSLGEIEHAIGTSLRAASEVRLPTTFADVSNLDKNDAPFARDDRRRLFGIGNRLWHSDSSFKVVPAKYSLLHAISVPSKGGNTQFADMRAAYDALDEETKAQVEGMVCEHSQMFSRQQIGFFDFTDEERQRFRPVRQCMVRVHPVTVGDYGGSSISGLRLATAQGGRDACARIRGLWGGAVFDVPRDGGPFVCYAAQQNHFFIRADGRVAKCTSAPDLPANHVGHLRSDGELEIDWPASLRWSAGFKSGRAGELACPLRALPDMERVAAPEHGGSAR
jgi:alpha-ketoglutarate-dependent 2,4-dichlorophenoxyacetate dioxygenase